MLRKKIQCYWCGELVEFKDDDKYVQCPFCATTNEVK